MNSYSFTTVDEYRRYIYSLSGPERLLSCIEGFTVALLVLFFIICCVATAVAIIETFKECRDERMDNGRSK